MPSRDPRRHYCRGRDLWRAGPGSCPKREPQPDDFAKLSMTRAVIQDHAAVSAGRVDWAFGSAPRSNWGYRIRAGAILVLSPWLIRHDLRFWPDPHRFDPGHSLWASGRHPTPISRSGWPSRLPWQPFRDD